MKTCSRCKKELSVNRFYKKDKRKNDGYDYVCKECTRIAYREKRIKYSDSFKRKDQRYYLSHKEEIKKKRHESYKKNIYKHRARYAVKQALYKGILVRPLSCSNCGKKNVMIEAQHKDYSKPLEVVWLCQTCHRREDFGLPHLSN